MRAPRLLLLRNALALAMPPVLPLTLRLSFGMSCATLALRLTLRYHRHAMANRRGVFQAQLGCQMCGTKFKTRFPTRAKYCSRACRARYHRKMVSYRQWIARGRVDPPPITEVSMTCKSCGKRLKTLFPKRSKFCSHACGSRWHRWQVTCRKYYAKQEAIAVLCR